VSISKRGPLAAALIALAVALSATATAVAAPSRVVGHVYVNDNTSPANTIAVFARHADGTLTAVPGSPFATGGAGTGSSIGSQGALQRAGDYLLAVDPASNQISVLRIGHDGRLTVVDVARSEGAEPVSIAVHHDLVYVANAGAGGSDYAGFRLGRDGILHPLAGARVALPDGSDPGDVLFNSTGTNLVGTRIGTSLIDSFAVGAGGRLTPAAGSPFAAQGPGPFGSEFDPVAPDRLYVSNAHGAPGAGTVSGFRVSRDGTLSSIGASPFADLQTAPCWVEIAHDGRYLYTVNTGSSSISTYRVERGGALALVGSTALRAASGLSPFDARLSPDGRSLWVVDNSGFVTGLAVDGARLSEFASSPTGLPAGASPFGIVVS